MADIAENDETAPTFRFKRRKIAYPRARLESDASPAPVPAEASLQVPSPLITDTASTTSPHDDTEEDVPNLKDILKNRKKPRHRFQETILRKPEVKSDALVHVGEAPLAQHKYSDRFVAQTGQVVGTDDRQMMDYVEARIAEQNHVKYGWPIPAHLAHAVRHLSLTNSTTPNTAAKDAPISASLAGAVTNKPAPDARMAAGMGKLQEIDLGPEATARNIQLTEQARRRMEGLPAEPAVEEPATNPKRKPRRWQKRRNSEDMRRDQMVEAVLRESKLEYFAENPNPNSTNTLGTPTTSTPIDADTAMAEQFRREFLESLESTRNARKPAPPSGGVKEGPKGPKMGGSRSARAAMALREKEEKMRGTGGGKPGGGNTGLR
ncbi:hypothetical protein B0J11DRAFT_561860 [Dendryphion nanum]|uniref:Hepatocellular carcinoma-associated antigen 59-domain-containing protein n=1 Tax=Dendryphion nanum TaxID=256645 RepID=A0A9P9IC21_9PLEO|nr:hypothetical protein B0J11DRAFT_561860 [Dendryphion nanum]